MKNRVMSIVATVSFLFVVSAVSAFAQAPDLQAPDLKANIPFDFQVNGKTMNAGEYHISEPVSPKGVVIIRGGEKVSAVASLVRAGESKKMANKTQLVFRRYGDQYFLAQMAIQGTTRTRELPVTKAERELINTRHLAGNKAEPQIVTVALVQ